MDNLLPFNASASRSVRHYALVQSPSAERFVPALPEEILMLARRARLMNAENGIAHPAIPTPPGVSSPTELVASRPEQSQVQHARFNERAPSSAAALLEELALGDTDIARDLQQLERRAITLMADDLGSGALIEIQKAAFAVRERLNFTLRNARELREGNEENK
jgi:hypothetical protein